MLASFIDKFVQDDGDVITKVPGLKLFRRSEVVDPVHCIYGLSLAVIAQGSKRVLLGKDVFEYGAGQSLLTTVDLPVVSQITEASPAQPYLSMLLILDTRTIVQRAAEMDLPPLQREYKYQSLSTFVVDGPLLDACLRLVKLLDESNLIPQLAPLIQQEIVVRLLMGPNGQALRQIVAASSSEQLIARTLAWLKTHFTQPLQIDALADSAHMSPSSFRQHFRAITGMSPLQYQKVLRLQEARKLMLNQHVDAGTAGIHVGYESASQFSREYSRLFGAPPYRDIQRMRQLQGYAPDA